jgi:hypothetical protein
VKIRAKCSWPMQTVIPKNPSIGVYEDKVHEFIGTVAAVRVDELVAWCKDNPDVPAKDLAASIENGEFA